MDISVAGVGSLWNIPDLQAVNEGNRHNYLVIGGYENNTLGGYQTMNVTSMENHEVTCEVPVMFKGYVGYIIPYNIYSFKKYTFLGKDVSPQGHLSGNIEEFIELLRDIYTDVTLNACTDKKFHANVEQRYNNYVKRFYNQHKDAEEFRYIKMKNNGTLGNRDTAYKPVLYGGKKLVDVPEKVIKFIVNRTSPNEINDEDLVLCYKSLSNIHQSEFRLLVPEIKSSQYFYNRKREFRQAIFNRPGTVQYLVN
jgi:hypothetical protein